ncbi:single-stranded DNA-binding protein [Polaromonas aquatica]|uniref:Single-stranded DNA-binding protein n=1 Tax=Polaromonas aquatica TaxID=332657 RepID=A0ABW1TWU1_9BURK
MIAITATGRLAHQPELKMIPGGSQVCEFRILDSRFHKGQEVTEAVTFFCFGEMAEEFCSTTVKGQEISATGTQETQIYTPQTGPARTYVKYRLSWFSRGRKPYTGERSQGNGYQGGAQQGQRPAQRQNDGPIPGQRPQQRPAAGQPDRNWQQGHERHQASDGQNSHHRERHDDFSHSGFEPSMGDEPGFLP